jgi:hypothetical protein
MHASTSHAVEVGRLALDFADTALMEGRLAEAERMIGLAYAMFDLNMFSLPNPENEHYSFHQSEVTAQGSSLPEWRGL